MEQPGWFFGDAASGQRAGPVTLHALAALMLAGTVTGGTLVWRAGMDGWVAASAVPELAGALASAAAAAAAGAAAYDGDDDAEDAAEAARRAAAMQLLVGAKRRRVEDEEAAAHASAAHAAVAGAGDSTGHQEEGAAAAVAVDSSDDDGDHEDVEDAMDADVRELAALAASTQASGDAVGAPSGASAPRGGRKPRGGGHGRGRGGAAGAWMYVSGLPMSTTEEEVEAFMRRAGMVARRLDDPARPRIKVYRDDEGACKGDAVVCYALPASMELAVTLLDGADFQPKCVPSRMEGGGGG
jgi:hypothetical protein